MERKHGVVCASLGVRVEGCTSRPSPGVAGEWRASVSEGEGVAAACLLSAQAEKSVLFGFDFVCGQGGFLIRGRGADGIQRLSIWFPLINVYNCTEYS